MRSFIQILKDNFKSLFTDFLFIRYFLILLITTLLGLFIVLLNFIYPLSFFVTFPLSLLIVYSLLDWAHEHNKNTYY